MNDRSLWEKASWSAMVRKAALIALTAVIWFVLGDSPSGPRALTPERQSPSLPQIGDALPPQMRLAQAQTGPTAQRRQVRRRPQVRVSPLHPYRRFHTVYPLPYDIEWPGQNAVRHCVNRYVTEARPSGTVLVPRTRCWWIRG